MQFLEQNIGAQWSTTEHNFEHNKENFGALLKSIIGKQNRHKQTISNSIAVIFKFQALMHLCTLVQCPEKIQIQVSHN